MKSSQKALLSSLYFIFVSLSLSACAPSLETPQEISEQTHAVIYGDDSREEITASSANIYDLAKATALIFSPESIKASALNQVSLKTSSLERDYFICKDEKFLQQPTLGFCSGVLIAPDKVLTAAHCLPKKDPCANMRFTFGRTLEKAQALNTLSSDIYSCRSIVKTDYNIRKNIDYTIIQLDRPVATAKPVKIARVESETQFLSLSYPLGLPLKKDTGKLLTDANSQNASEELPIFKVQVDTFYGSSGSPLFNSQGFLVGILSRGQEDITEDEVYRARMQNTCQNFNRVSELGETFFKASHIEF